MDAVTLLAQARAAGLEPRAEGDRLVVCGPLAAEPLVVQFRRYKPEVVAILGAGDAEVSWRVAAVRARLEASTPPPADDDA